MFNLVSKYEPTGDQPRAIDELTQGINSGYRHQTLLGVTGSGKTFTMANVLARTNRPTLVLSHNKTLAAQLYAEFKAFFPENSVHYFVSYYDYYQPEAYIPSSDKYIEKDLAVNMEIDRLRLATTKALLSGRKDIVVVSSVSCLYGMGNPEDFAQNIIKITVGQNIGRDEFLRRLVDALYSRSETTFEHGDFRVKGDTVDVFIGYEEIIVRVIFWGNEIESIQLLNPNTQLPTDNMDEFMIYPASIFVTPKARLGEAIGQIAVDLGTQVNMFASEGRMVEANRLKERVNCDIEMIKETGYCTGIENYSRYFDGRQPGMRPFCLLDYMPEGYITIIDESHVTVPQIRAMFGGDQARKANLITYGFRLQAAADNRPLRFEEWEQLSNQIIYVSATPADYELQQCEGVVTEQIIRPTGLLDPIIEVRPAQNQIDDLVDEIHFRVKNDERTLVTTLTKRMAEELSDYIANIGIRVAYIHSDVDTMERIEILDKLRAGELDVLVGVNLLREGLDLPEVSLVAIIDADKEGFLRNNRSLTQTAGRAARNLNGKVIMYADKITDSMAKTIAETDRRRSIQLAYNEKHHITPTAIIKARQAIIGHDNEFGAIAAEPSQTYTKKRDYDTFDAKVGVAHDPVVQYMSVENLDQAIIDLGIKMMQAAKEMKFIQAAQYRDEKVALEQLRDQRIKEAAKE